MRWIFVAVAVAACAEPTDVAGQGGPPVSSSTMARLGDWLIAANAEEQSVSLIDPGLQEAVAVRIDGEPSHVATHGDRAWVTLRETGHVMELEAHQGQLNPVQWSHVGAEPVGIVASSDGTRLYVAVSIDRRVVELDADTLLPLRMFDGLAELRWLALHGGGTLFAAAPDQGVVYYLDVTREAPLWGLITLPPLGGQDRRVSGDMAISPVGESLVIPALEQTEPVLTADAYYAPADGLPGVVTPVLHVAELDEDTGTPTQKVESILLGEPSYVSSVTFVRDDAVVATTPGAARAVRVFLEEGQRQSAVTVSTGGQGAAIDPEGTAWVHSVFDLTVTSVFGDSFPIGQSQLPELVQQGRDLFFTTTDPVMTRGGVSCASCHAEGRSDNRTWRLIHGAYQTPSLAGGIGATAPMSWINNVATVREEAALTAELRMGGDGKADYHALATYIETLRRPNPPTATVDAQTLTLGRRAFDKAQCSTCHPAPLFTDNQSHALFTRHPIQTPSLRGLASTAPYLHDGRALGLEQVLVMADEVMGVPGVLTPPERDALLHYLRSL